MVADAKLRELIRNAPKGTWALIDFLREGLSWPLPDVTTLQSDDILIDWKPEELHLDPAKVARLIDISQLPPLTAKQNFGVFFLNFDGRNLPITAVRRLVHRLVSNKRGKGGGTHPTWALDDLIFFCVANGDQQFIHVVNFREKEGKRVLRVLSWSDKPTETRLDLLIRKAVPELSWTASDAPQLVTDRAGSRALASYREGLRSAKQLSRRMAEVAQDVRDEVADLLAVETKTGPIRGLYRDVREQLLGDISPERFADVYAQTMVYGLLTARIAHPEQFESEQSLAVMKFDNEFLDAIYARFREGSDGIVDVDELGLADLAEQLASTNVDELLADFGADNQRDDPVVYFYEEFLAQYDPEQRKDLGAFYTPKPVVRYIVKTVDDALKSFGLPLGVADPTTWGEYVKAHPEIAIPKGALPEDSVVSMFDPANGTGTFLVEWLEQAKRNAGEVGLKTALSHASALEISLASYAVSHLKVSLDLPEDLREQERIPVFLGDTLSEKRVARISGLDDPIGAEGVQADRVKYDWHHNVLIGNPPYDRVESQGTGGFITAVTKGNKTIGERSLFDDIFDDARKHTIFSHHASVYNLYVYFWRWAIWKVFEENTGPAVVSMITASSWLDGPGFLGLRRLAREVADEITVVDLHGDNKGAHKDENVFDIESPVAIVTLVRHGNGDRSTPAPVRYSSFRGTRTYKLSALNDLANGKATLSSTDASSAWHATFVPAAGGDEWATYPATIDLLPFQMPGCKFNRTWPIAPTEELLKQRWERFISTDDVSDRERCFVTGSGRNIHTKVAGLKKLADEPIHAKSAPIVRYGYRSFDRQWAFQDPRLAALERPALWASLSGKQLFLLTKPTFRLGRGPAAVVSVGVPDLDHFRGSFGGKDVIPLYRDATGTPNADPAALGVLSEKLGIKVTVEELFAYIFGMLAGTDYTDRFHEALETPGPRVPVTLDPGLFVRMVVHGEKLIWLQTFGERFGSDKLPTAGIGWKSEPSRLPEARADIKYDPATETLQVADGVLTGVPANVWNFEVSGMDVIPKWLGYRMSKPAGRAASSDSPLDHIRPSTWVPEWSAELTEIVAAIKQTLALIPEGVTLLEAIIAGPLIAADDLPPVPAALRKPPTGKAADGQDEFTFDDGMLPGTNEGGLF
ncbi:type ISP restriction/modification enzyme [Tessaracoccus massiliensis]|uniref:type ISP restriction/modification enzyme n=1 Tax=Tessaracoccus massiliensis TaxID=1522311 RepID=UPI0005916D2E|nr:type ISP restriction/modification enzyme [Tessaracoccus massiliensis]